MEVSPPQQQQQQQQDQQQQQQDQQQQDQQQQATMTMMPVGHHQQQQPVEIEMVDPLPESPGSSLISPVSPAGPRFEPLLDVEMASPGSLLTIEEAAEAGAGEMEERKSMVMPARRPNEEGRPWAMQWYYAAMKESKGEESALAAKWGRS